MNRNVVGRAEARPTSGDELKEFACANTTEETAEDEFAPIAGVVF